MLEIFKEEICSVLQSEDFEIVEQLQELYNGEKQLVKALQKIKTNITEPKLLEAVEKHIATNEDQIMRLKRAFDILYVKQKKKEAEVIEALISRLKSLVKMSADPEVMDAAIITAIQHVNHYEIASYGAICTYANMLGQYPLGAIIHENLEEEKNMDKKLAIIAEEVVNRKAQMISQGD